MLIKSAFIIFFNARSNRSRIEHIRNDFIQINIDHRKISKTHCKRQISSGTISQTQKRKRSRSPAIVRLVVRFDRRNRKTHWSASGRRLRANILERTVFWRGGGSSTAPLITGRPSKHLTAASGRERRAAARSDRRPQKHLFYCGWVPYSGTQRSFWCCCCFIACWYGSYWSCEYELNLDVDWFSKVWYCFVSYLLFK